MVRNEREMKIMWQRGTVSIGILLAGICGVSGAVHADSIPSGLVPLIGKLAGEYKHTLGDQREQFDRLNRRLRDLEHRIGRAEGDEKEQLREAMAEASAEAMDAMQALPWLIEVELQDGVATSDLDAPVEFQDDYGALLLKVTAPGEAVQCAIRGHDMATEGREWPGIQVGIGPEGTTWTLVEFTRVPRERTSWMLEFKPSGSDQLIKWPFQLMTGPRGRLALTVINDDTGEPGPAMLQITNARDGREYTPSNAIEFAHQFDKQGHPSGRRFANYYKNVRGNYWCVPGPLDMVLPAGEWRVKIRRGVEHIPVIDKIVVQPNQVTAREYRPKRWVDMRHSGWYSGDDHVHCQILSDGDAERLMAYAIAEDVHLVNVVKMGDIFRTWFEQRGWGPEHRVIERDYILSPGQECPRTHGQLGHTIHMNTKRMVRDTDKYYLYDWVFDNVHAEGGLTGYAHVLSDAFFVHRDMSINIPKGKVDFVEIMQFARLGTDLFYAFLNAGFEMTAAAGSDIPWGGTMGEVRMYAYVGDQPFSADAWFDGVRRGRTFVSNGPMIEFRVEQAYPGDTVKVYEERKLRVTARAWGHADRVKPTKLEIVQHGEVIQTATPTKDSPYEMSVDFEIDAGFGSWVAARVEGSQGERAHTSPIYVVREGYRFWKFEELPALIQRANGYLDEVEGIVQDAQARDARGELETDRTLKQLALQGPALLERVEAAREIYRKLEEVAAKERLGRERQ